MTTRCRFAPSPTGTPHIGHFRSAIYAWLTTKKEDGVFYMRLEDTDQDRFVAGTADILIKAIKWVGIDQDEGFMGEGLSEIGEYGPYVQSKRKDLYKKYAEELVGKGGAFYCFCPKEERDKNEESNPRLVNIHDFNCRNLSKEEVDERLARGDSYVIKHKVPLNEMVTIEDVIHGTKKIDTNTLDDSVLLKSDGHATYHLAHLVDDYLMETTYVIRSEEWLPSLPKHTLLFNQMGWKTPKYAHPSLVMIIDKDTGNKRKFSKRKGDPTAIDLIKAGYLSEAIFNYIVFLGWNPGGRETREIYSKEELVKVFDLKNCHKAGALFDIEKLNWMNSKYIESMTSEQLFIRLSEYLKEYDTDFYENIFSKADKNYNIKIINELKGRMKKLSEYKELTDFFYSEPSVNQDFLLNEKMGINNIDFAKKGIKLTLDILNTNDIDFENIDSIKNVFIEKIKESGMKNGQVLWPTRICLSGKEHSPGAFELMFILGKDLSMERIVKIFEII